MKEKHLKRFYESSAKSLDQHCKKNKIDIQKVECVMSENSKMLTYSAQSKIIMVAQLIDEPQIKITKFKI